MFKEDFSDSLGGPPKKKLLAGRMQLAGRYLPTPGLGDKNAIHDSSNSSQANKWKVQANEYSVF
jgi:hypothetical protein